LNTGAGLHARMTEGNHKREDWIRTKAGVKVSTLDGLADWKSEKVSDVGENGWTDSKNVKF